MDTVVVLWLNLFVDVPVVYEYPVKRLFNVFIEFVFPFMFVVLFETLLSVIFKLLIKLFMLLVLAEILPLDIDKLDVRTEISLVKPEI